jgi:tetratricopeptide (TPR) repeat protein
MAHPARGRHYFQKAVELDPNLLPAYLWLCHVYGALRQTRERNRLLDEMTRRFPEEKAVLLQAANRCAERKAFPKALDLLERARNLDRLDPIIPAMIVYCRRQFAWQQFEQRHPDKARQILAAAEEFLTDKPDDFQVSRWANAARHGVQEQLFGDPAAGERLLAQARGDSPFAGAFLLFAHLAYRLYAKKPSKASPFYGELRSELNSGASAVRAARLLRQLEFWSHSQDAPETHNERSLVRGYVRAAAKPGCSREDAKTVVELCLASSSQEEARLFIKAALRRDPDDPLFRFYDHSLRAAWQGPAARHRGDLEKILSLAQARRDEEAIQKIQRALRALDRPPPMPPVLDPFSEDEEDEEDEEDGDDWTEPAGGVLPPLPPLPPHIAAEMRQLMDALRNASPAEVKELRRTAGKDVPPFILDMIIQAARSGNPPPSTPRPNRRPGPGSSAGQRDLF